MKKRLIAFLLVITLTASAVLFGACSNTDIDNPVSTGSSNPGTSNPGTPSEGGVTSDTTVPSAPNGGDATSGTTMPSAPNSGDPTTGTTIPSVPNSSDPTTGTTAPSVPNSGSTTPDATVPNSGNEGGGATEGSTPQGGNNSDANNQGTTPGGTQKPTEPGAQTHTHTDANNDEKCDTCYESVVVIIDFYAINDLHGKFCDTDTQPGVDNLATYLKSREQYDDNVVIFSTGDMWQGASESNLTNGMILTEWMNEMNFVSMTLGNHEYDWGEEAIRKNLAVAEFPFLAINIYNKSTGKLADYCTPSVIVECGDIQVGIIGAIGDCYSSISADMVSNVEFKVGKELTALVKAESDRLRAQGVDLIVYSLHDGNGSSNSSAGSISTSNLASYYDAALSNGYVDLVFEGHTHKKYVYYDAYQVYHMQGGGENKGITHVEISMNFVTGKKKVNQAEVVNNSVYGSYAEDPATEAIEDKYADIINQANSVIGKVSSKLSSSKVADVVAELYLKAGLEKWGSNYNIVLGGGFIKTRSPYDLAAGDVTYSDLLSLLPFDNQLVLCSIKGSELKSKFISTTNSSYHNYYSTYGNSIKNNVSSNATYYVVVDTYTAFYAPNKLTIVDYYDEGVFARDLLAAEVRSGRFQ